MINNVVIPNIILPCPNCTDVQNRDNWFYDLDANLGVESVPTDIPANVVVGSDTYDEYDWREHISLIRNSPLSRSSHGHTPHAHITPFFLTLLQV